MQILDELYNETRRIFIAGSQLAKNDPRITKFISPLEQMGEKAPVMKKLAQKYLQLTQTGSADALAEAATLLQTVKVTQCDSSFVGEAVENDAFFKELPTASSPHSILSPVVNALESTGNGRANALMDGIKNEAHKDYRITKKLVDGLFDPVQSIRNYCEDAIIDCSYSVQRLLLDKFDVSSSSIGMSRIPYILHKFGYENIESLLLESLESKNSYTKETALKLLGLDIKNEDLLISFLSDKKASIRSIALESLSKLQSKKIFPLLLKMFKSSLASEACNALVCYNNPEQIEEILSLYNQFLEDIKSDNFNLYTYFNTKTEYEQFFKDTLAEKMMKSLGDSLQMEKVIQFYADFVQYFACNIDKKAKKGQLLGNVRTYMIVLAVLKTAKVPLETVTKILKFDSEDYIPCFAQLFFASDGWFDKAQSYEYLSPIYKKLSALKSNNHIFIRENGNISGFDKAVRSADSRWAQIFASTKDFRAIKHVAILNIELAETMFYDLGASSIDSHEIGDAIGVIARGLYLDSKSNAQRLQRLKKACEDAFEICSSKTAFIYSSIDYNYMKEIVELLGIENVDKIKQIKSNWSTRYILQYINERFGV